MHQLIYQSIHWSILDWVSVDTRSSIGRYIGRVSTDVSTDTPIGRYTWWLTETSPMLHRYFTDTSPILHRYCTNASLTLNLHRVYWLISVNILFDTLIELRWIRPQANSPTTNSPTHKMTRLEEDKRFLCVWLFYYGLGKKREETVKLTCFSLLYVKSDSTDKSFTVFFARWGVKFDRRFKIAARWVR